MTIVKFLDRNFSLILTLSIVLPVILIIIIPTIKNWPEASRYKKECLNKNGFVYNPTHGKRICLKKSSVIEIDKGEL